MNNKTLLAAMAVILLSRAAMAQQAASASDRVVYEAGFYSSFAPRTALDMVNQTPGFVLAAEGNAEDRRGFAGAVGNVLIDGQRLGAKSQSLRDVLGRVAAREVLRIEVLRGNAVAGDASGASVLANVVRTPSAGGGTWEAGLEVTNEGKPTPTGKFGWSGRKDATEFSLGGSAYTHDHLSAGWFESRDGNGALLGRKNEGFPHQHGEYALNGQVSLPAGDGKLTVTGQASYFRHDETYFQRAFDADDDLLARESIPFNEHTRTGEAGITWQKPVGSWDMNLTALATRKNDRWHTSALEFDAQDALQSEAFQNVITDSGETIVRATFARNVDSGRFEYGAETAVNTLDGEQQLTIDDGDGPVPVNLANANLEVEETRGEGFVSYARRMNDVWTLDSRLAADTSRLTFTGDT
jgi:hypothetical protein